MRVLLVEDDEMIGHSLRDALSAQGWSVDWVKDGLLAQSAWADGDYACVLLDLGLPKRDGVEVLRHARSRGDATPVLVLTARDGVDDRVEGLDLGADDYLLKPYEMRELLARMRAVIRRRDGSAHSTIGNAMVQLDLTTREVLVEGERSQLSAREFALLHALLERPRCHPVARTAGESHLWLGRRGEQQRGRCPDPRHASQAGTGHHPQRARPGLARGRRRRGSGTMKWHVFPNGPMCSIRRAMMLWLVPLFLAVGTMAAVISYWSFSRMVNTFMDEQMQQLATALVDNQTIQPMPLDAERVLKWGAYVVQTYDPSGAKKVTSWPDLTLGLQSTAGFHDVEHEGRGWRVYTLPAYQSGSHAVQVLQSDGFRAKLAAERAGAAVAPILLLLPLSMFALWVVARAMSRALQDIARQAAGQDEHTISELAVKNIPSEIAPMVSSFNSLLRRLRDAFATQRRFVQDAAHELRTPIAAIGLQMENMRHDMNCPAAEDRFAQLESGVRRAQRLVDQLLRLSRQEAAGADGPAIVDLRTQLRESMNTLIGLADQRNIDLGFVGTDGGQHADHDALRFG
jgi:DNA-binding response OmpR family regulator